MLRKVACLFVIAFIIGPAMLIAQNASKEKAAVASAEKWLGLIDNGEYAASWKDAGTFFRNNVTEQKWEHAMQGMRKPLGSLVSRKLKTDAYKTSLPGAPDGEYVVMQFDTSFANKKSAVETVTMVLDKDGQWRAVGYFIR
jgi:hypothetical protein